MSKSKAPAVASNRAVIYLRVSTLEQAEGGRGWRRAWSSIDTQRELCEAHCLVRGLEVVAVEVDAGVSGSRFFHSRPAGKRVQALLKSGRASHVVSPRLDRLFRSVGDALKQIEDWTEQGVSVHLLDLQIDTSTSVGRLVLTVLSGVAAMEREQLGERVAEALRARKLSGRVYAAKVYGYRAVGGRMVEVPEEQEVIAFILSERRRGVAMAEIARDLNARGVPSSRPARGGRSGAGRWHTTSIKRLLAAVAERAAEAAGEAEGGKRERQRAS